METIPLVVTGLTATMSVFMIFKAALKAESFAMELFGDNELKIVKEQAPKIAEMVLCYITLYKFVQAVVKCFIFVMILSKTIPTKLAMSLHLAYWIAFGLAASIVQPWPSMNDKPFKLFDIIPITDGTILSIVWITLSAVGFATASSSTKDSKNKTR